MKGWTERENVSGEETRSVYLSSCVPQNSGKEQIHHQIQRRLEEKLMQDEMKKSEREQMLEKLENMNLEDFRVLRGNRNTTQNRRNEV